MQTQTTSHTLGSLFVARRAELRAIAIRIVRQADWAEDILQDTYVKVAMRRGEQPVANPFGYCCQAVRHTALDQLRRRTFEAGLMFNADDSELPYVCDEREPSCGIDERRMLRRVEVALSVFPERSQLVFDLSRLQGKTQREIGRMVGVSATLVNFTLREMTEALAPLRDFLC